MLCIDKAIDNLNNKKFTYISLLLTGKKLQTVPHHISTKDQRIFNIHANYKCISFLFATLDGVQKSCHIPCHFTFFNKK